MCTQLQAVLNGIAPQFGAAAFKNTAEQSEDQSVLEMAGDFDRGQGDTGEKWPHPDVSLATWRQALISQQQLEEQRLAEANAMQCKGVFYSH